MRFCKSRPLRPGRVTSSTRQLGTRTRQVFLRGCKGLRLPARAADQRFQRCRRQRRTRLAWCASSVLTLVYGHALWIISSKSPRVQGLRHKALSVAIPRPAIELAGIQSFFRRYTVLGQPPATFRSCSVLRAPMHIARHCWFSAERRIGLIPVDFVRACAGGKRCRKNGNQEPKHDTHDYIPSAIELIERVSPFSPFNTTIGFCAWEVRRALGKRDAPPFSECTQRAAK
jgi:hypothetical protein